MTRPLCELAFGLSSAAQRQPARVGVWLYAVTMLLVASAAHGQAPAQQTPAPQTPAPQTPAPQTPVPRTPAAQPSAQRVQPAQTQPAAPQQDRATLDRSQIIGNRELPKVLYIVPWKRPSPPDLAMRPAGGTMDEVLAPLDRDIFRRQLRYDAASASRASESSGAAQP